MGLRRSYKLTRLRTYTLSLACQFFICTSGIMRLHENKRKGQVKYFHFKRSWRELPPRNVIPTLCNWIDRDVDVDFFIVQKLFASAVHQILLNQHILIRKYGLKYICNIILWTPKGNQPVQQNLLQLLLRYCFCQTTARSWSTKLSFKSFSQLGIMEQLRWEGSVGGQSVNLLLKAESALRTGLVSQGFI